MRRGEGVTQILKFSNTDKATLRKTSETPKMLQRGVDAENSDSGATSVRMWGGSLGRGEPGRLAGQVNPTLRWWKFSVKSSGNQSGLRFDCVDHICEIRNKTASFFDERCWWKSMEKKLFTPSGSKGSKDIQRKIPANNTLHFFPTPAMRYA